MPPTTISLILVTFLSTVILAAEPPPDFKFMVNFWGSDSCCGYGFGISVVRPGECVYVGSSRPGGEGSSIQISSSPRSSSSYDPMSYGYGIGFSDAACTNKTFEIRTRGCFVAPDLQHTLRSFSFQLDPNMPQGRRRVSGEGSKNVAVDRSTSGDTEASTPQPRGAHRDLEWFQYMDNNLGRIRKIVVNQPLAHRVVDLYNAERWTELQALEE